MARGPRSVRPHARLLKYVLWLTLESSSILLTELSSSWQPLPLHPLFFKIGSHSGALAGLDSRQSSCLSLLNPEMKGRATSAKAVCTHHHHQCENIFIISKETDIQPCSHICPTSASSSLHGQLCRPWDSLAPPAVGCFLHQNSIHTLQGC